MSRDWKDVKLAAVEARKDKADELARVTAERDRLREACESLLEIVEKESDWAIGAIAEAKAALDGKGGEE